MSQGENSIPLYHEIHPSVNVSAPWVLFIHGAGGSTRTWRKQIDVFKEKFNLLLIDLPGHAKSQEATLHQDFYNFEWIANKIWEVVDLIGVKKVHIAAVSLGSIIAMQMRHNRPDQVAGMVFAGPIVALTTKLRILAKTGLALARVIGFQNFYAVTARLTLPRKNHQKSREIFVRESKRITDAEYKKWTAMYGRSLDETLTLLFSSSPNTPVYFLIGTQDHLFMQPALVYAEKHPEVSVEMIDRCGHLVSLEKSELFNEKSLAYLIAQGR
jgi:pimeloyl-ACP methyl ester carboxylesterase